MVESKIKNVEKQIQNIEKFSERIFHLHLQQMLLKERKK